jgi:hypothetical protein
MPRIEERLRTLGLIPPPPKPPGVRLPFEFVRISGRRALISGHGPQCPDGSFAAPLGKHRTRHHRRASYAAARLTALSILGSLQRALGDLDRISAWVRVFGMVNSAPGFQEQPSVINGFSGLILELLGLKVGVHAVAPTAWAELPFNIPVEIEGEGEFVG